jgi:hypothetical protein
MPVTGTWSQDYHDRVEENLMQATLAASTESDHQALELLKREYVLLSKWADTVLGEREALNAERSIDPNSLDNDPKVDDRRRRFLRRSDLPLGLPQDRADDSQW